MSSQNVLRVLLIAPHISREATGEGFMAFKWAEALSEKVILTVAALQSPTHTPLAEQLPRAEVVTWPEPALLRSARRFRAMLKPEWPVFQRHIRRFLKAEASRFDIGHQIMPLGMRYATPLRGYGLPYVMGPLGGAIGTPSSFAAETAKAPWFTKLRALDGLRLRHDPWLRASYSEAALILGVAPYVQERLKVVPIRRYRNMLELGIDSLAPERDVKSENVIQLLHVGRGIRTKGLRDVVRALGLLRHDTRLRLVSAGGGEDLEVCRKEAEQLGIGDRVTFLGTVPRSQVEELYRKSDIFVFPSFREPTGGVLYEAMRWGLPIITANIGGPAWIVDDTCGLRLDVTNPERFARDVAGAIQILADDPELRRRLGASARAKVAAEGLWPDKAERLVEEYRGALGA